ncbi:hypothetical protein LEP1GSC188_2924 [Leptospira weilii serovar Topaz str. LT2116]|uniref:Uncharacterized protein n=1 Tax=Leptospira weilii serovar Topaz str. LT2116 TaxID=1088540 RepID=M3ENV2_9LEPT|nr:hypothetical protein LEP1GSC188_2924 [Leptospira weilii serovar Topaz str. LT2116]
MSLNFDEDNKKPKTKKTPVCFLFLNFERDLQFIPKLSKSKGFFLSL